PGAERRASDHGCQKDRVYRDRGYEYRGLHKGSGVVSDVERAGNELIWWPAPKFEERRGGRERPDSQGIEEIGHQADDDVPGRRSAFLWVRTDRAQPAAENSDVDVH